MPLVIEVGLAESVHDGAGCAVTVTDAGHVTVPPGPVAVSVYAVVDAGETDTEPLASGAIAPIP